MVEEMKRNKTHLFITMIWLVYIKSKRVNRKNFGIKRVYQTLNYL